MSDSKRNSKREKRGFHHGSLFIQCVAAQHWQERETGELPRSIFWSRRGFWLWEWRKKGEQEHQLQDTFAFNPRAVRNLFVYDGMFRVPFPIPELILLLSNNGNPMLYNNGAILSCSNNCKLIELQHCFTGNWCTSTVNTVGWNRVKGPVSHKHSHEDQYSDLIRHTFCWFLWDKAQVNLDLDNLNTVTNKYNTLYNGDKRILGDTRLQARYLRNQKKKFIRSQSVTNGGILTVAPEDCLTDDGDPSSLAIQYTKIITLLALLLFHQ